MPGNFTARTRLPALQRVKAALAVAVTGWTLISCQSVTKKQPGGSSSGDLAPGARETPHEPPTLPADPAYIYKMAHVESIKANLTRDGASTASVVITGWLNDGATSIREVRQQSSGQTVTITVITARRRDAMATLALIPFERKIAVDLAGMTAGPVTLSVNGVTSTIAR